MGHLVYLTPQCKTNTSLYLTLKTYTSPDEIHTHTQPGVEVSQRVYGLKEGNVKLKLTLVDSVGYGDQINKENR